MMMIDKLEHLDALYARLSNEKIRLSNAKSPVEIEMRSVWVHQIKKEIAQERELLGLIDDVNIDISDDEIFARLNA